MKELVGKTILEMYVSKDDQSFLKFVDADNNEHVYEAYGDCCSESWFADIIFSDYWRNKVFPFVIKDVKQIDMPEWARAKVNSDGKTRQECDEVYGYKIELDVGSIEIVYRNSRNGYYGGWCEYVNGDNDCENKRVAEQEWLKIEKDWSFGEENE